MEKENNKTKIEVAFLGAIDTVTGSSTLLKYTCGDIESLYLIDCGMELENNSNHLKNNICLKEIAKKIKSIFITHAHLDHIGLVPNMVDYGFEGNIICTEATKELMSVILSDNLKKNKPSVKLLSRLNFLIVNFDKNQIQNSIILEENLSFHILRSSHILGSCSYVFTTRYCTDEDFSYTFHFSGDIGPFDNNILDKHENFTMMLKDHCTPYYGKCSRFVIMESTYGARERDCNINFEDRLKDLKSIIEEAIENNSKVIIPVFSLHRAQQLLFDLYLLNKENEKITYCIKSELIKEINKSYIKFLGYSFMNNKNDIKYTYMSKQFMKYYLKNDFDDCNLKEQFTKILKIKKNKSSKDCVVTISSSGMCDKGSIVNLLDIDFLKNNKNIIIFTGYQAKNTAGYYLNEYMTMSDQEKYNINILNNIKLYNVKCKIKNLSKYYSGHADQKQLVEYVHGMSAKVENNFPTCVLLNHGTKSQRETLKQKILEKNATYKHCISVILPKKDLWYELDFKNATVIEKGKIGLNEDNYSFDINGSLDLISNEIQRIKQYINEKK